MTVPDDAPAHCPGTESEQAGKDAACAGCPNQEICSTKPKGPDPDIPKITSAMENVKHKILVLSGKGGVGKSTFTALLGWGIGSDEDKQLGLIDLDFCGPSLARIFGVEGNQLHSTVDGWQPVYVEDNMAMMSISYMLPATDEPVIWRGDKKTGMIKQFLINTDWDEQGLDYLVIDTPPGTGDEHISLSQYLQPSGLDGAVLVSTPQEVALLDVRKEIDFCRKANIPILGLVENMAGFVCPNCQGKSDIFVATTGGGKKFAEEMGIPFLGSVPLDPRIGRCGDEGLNFVEEYPESPTTAAIKEVLLNLEMQVGEESSSDSTSEHEISEVADPTPIAA